MGTLAQLFETGEQTSQKGHFRNLVMIARYDGVIDVTERNLLNRIASKLSLTDEQVKEILDNPDSYAFVPPYSREERYERYIQLLQMASITSPIPASELQFVKKMGIALGFSEDTIEAKTNVILDKVKNGISREEILEQVL